MIVWNTQLPHKVPCYSLSYFPMALNIPSKITSITVFQYKKYPIFSLNNIILEKSNYSKTILKNNNTRGRRVEFTSKDSKRRIMLGWFIVLRIEISLSKLSLTFGLSNFLSISLTATSKHEDRCLALRTTAKDPRPIIGPRI